MSAQQPEAAAELPVSASSTTISRAAGLLRPPHLRWNSTALIVDYMVFSMGMAFVNQTTVVPALVSHLTDSAPLIGLAAAISSGGFLLPQLFVATYVSGKERKKPYMLIPAFIGRPLYFVLAFALLTMGDSHPDLLLPIFFFCYTLFALCDGCCGAPWFDILAKAIPPDLRGKIMGFAQTSSSLLAVGVGVVVGLILGNPDLSFPTNFGLLFGIAGVFFMLSAVTLATIKEPIEPMPKQRQALAHFAKALAPILREDALFRRVTVVRLLAGAGAMVAPFFVVYVADVHGLSGQWVGFFLSMQVAGTVVGGIGLGALGDRWGTKRVIQVGSTLGMLGPAIAVVTWVWPHLLGDAAPYVFAAMFGSVGVMFSSYLLGFVNLVLESSQPHNRPIRVGLFNTIAGVLLLAPPIFGWVIQMTSYGVAFGLAAAAFTVGLALTVGIKDPRTTPTTAV